ncbi:MAG: PEP-CTERM sorting domain-containing protein [Chthoniobacteraceae bacterium]
MKKNHYLSMAAVLLGLTSGSLVNARAEVSFTMSIVADNDFAVFAGTANGVTQLLYQNDSEWSSQISNLSTLTFTLPEGTTTFYILAMGGGGQENIQGYVNGVDITTISGVQVSSDLGSSLTNWSTASVAGGTVEAGTYDASLSDVQSAFSSLTWSDASSTVGGGNVTYLSGFDQGYEFDSSTAHLYSFSASDVGVEAVPEPSSVGLAVMGGASLWMLRRRKSK